VNRYFLILATIAAVSAVGCASVEQQQSAGPREEKVYNTGSRIPLGGGSSPVRSVTPTKETQEDIRAGSQVVVPGKGGGM
jgi:hypothetical protein